jgi:hypothetical protein
MQDERERLCGQSRDRYDECRSTHTSRLITTREHDIYRGTGTVTGDSSVSLRTYILIVNNIYWLFAAHISLLCKSYSSCD